MASVPEVKSLVPFNTAPTAVLVTVSPFRAKVGDSAETSSVPPAAKMKVVVPVIAPLPIKANVLLLATTILVLAIVPPLPTLKLPATLTLVLAREPPLVTVRFAPLMTVLPV